MITSVSVTSRRSMKLKEEFYVFETGYTADVTNMDDKDVDDYIASLYERANALVDDQAEETVKSLTPNED